MKNVPFDRTVFLLQIAAVLAAIRFVIELLSVFKP